MNLGLMRYSNNEGGDAESSAQGGMVTYPVVQLTDDHAPGNGGDGRRA